MSLVDFPKKPEVNQVYSINDNRSWVWNGYAWDLTNINSSICVRPDDWLNIGEMPTEGFVGLLGIVNHDVNKIALSAEGAFIVDWGDDSPLETFASGAKAEHVYNYANISNRTISSRGYKQVIVKVTPQVSGGFTSIDIDRIHSSWSYPTFTTVEMEILWLDIMVAGPSLVGLELAQNDIEICCNSLERVRIGYNAITDTGYLFHPSPGYSWDGLCRFEMDMSNVTVADDMFNSYNIRSISLTNTGNITSATDMFNYCYYLLEVSFDRLDSLIYADWMFWYCTSLREINLPDAPVLNTMFYMCEGCRNLKSFSIGNTPLLTDLTGAFYYCSQLESVTIPNLSSIIYMAGTFYSCYKLKDLNLGEITSSVKNVSAVIDYCPGIRSFGVADASNLYNTIPQEFGFSGLEKLRLPGLKEDLYLDTVKLDRQAIIQLFNDLAIVTNKTIKFYYNIPGVLELTPSDIEIATNKGWTVII